MRLVGSKPGDWGWVGPNQHLLSPTPQRVMFISLLEFIDNKTVTGFVGMVASILCGHMYERFEPFHVPSTNRLATVACKQLLITYIAATLVQLG